MSKPHDRRHRTTRAVWAFLTTYQRKHGRFPTHAEIAAAVGLCSFGSTHYHLAKLMQQGYIARSRAHGAITVIVPLYEARHA